MKSKQSLKRTFFQGIRWNLTTSITYELCKLIHQAAVLHVCGPTLYGVIGSIFSFIYFTLHIIDLESGPSLLPFIDGLRKNRNLFTFIISRYLMLQMIFLFGGSCIALYIYNTCASHITTPGSIPGFLVCLIIFLEGIRFFLRNLLHGLFIHKPTSLIDLSATTTYFISIWTSYSITRTITITTIFIPYAATSAITILGFSILLYKTTKTFPSEPLTSPLSTLIQRIIRTRFYRYTTHASKYFFSGNFLTPVFAFQYGFEYAGLFKFASYLADSIKAIVNVSIGFSGGALLAAFKQRSLVLKRKIFLSLWTTFNKIWVPIALFTLINYQRILMLWHFSKKDMYVVSAHHLPESLILTSGLLLFMYFIENFFMVYEEFYLIEEQTNIFIFLRLLELIPFLMLLFYQSHTPSTLFITCIALRLTSLTLIALHAYKNWKIRPSFTIVPHHLFITIVISCIFFLVPR